MTFAVNLGGGQYFTAEVREIEDPTRNVFGSYIPHTYGIRVPQNKW